MTTGIKNILLNRLIDRYGYAGIDDYKLYIDNLLINGDDFSGINDMITFLVNNYKTLVIC